jgi:ligand-binding SRPBCC domain-containing protein
MIQVFEKKQLLPCSIETAWTFFSDPKNLARITPPDMDFRVMSTLPSNMYEGMMIRYRVKPLFNISTSWLTEITHIQQPHFFVDEQRVGPYQLWHHEHHFEETPEGVLMTDIIHYVIPFGIIGLLAKPLVQYKLNQIFKYREHSIKQLF